MSPSARAFFDDVAREFRVLAIERGYDATKYPSRGIRVNIYHNKAKFRLRDSWNVVRSGIYNYSNQDSIKIPPWELAKRIFEELQDRSYIVAPGIRPKLFRDQEALLRPEPR